MATTRYDVAFCEELSRAVLLNPSPSLLPSSFSSNLQLQMNPHYMNMQGMPPMGYPQPYPYSPYGMPYPPQQGGPHYAPHPQQQGGPRGMPKYSTSGPGPNNRPQGQGYGGMQPGERGYAREGDAPPVEHIDLKFGAFPAELSATDGPLEPEAEGAVKKESGLVAAADSLGAAGNSTSAAEAQETSSSTPAQAPASASVPVPATVPAKVGEAVAAPSVAASTPVAAPEEKETAAAVLKRGRALPPVGPSAEASPTESSEWARVAQAPGDGGKGGASSAPSGFGSPRGGHPPTPTANGKGDGGWKRGEFLQPDAPVARADGVKRYDKSALLALYTSKKVVPESIKDLYLQLAKIERAPKSGKVQQRSKGDRGGQTSDDPHPDEQLIFAQKDGPPTTFRYQPSLLSNTTDPAVILMNANLILNKLSVTKFDKLSDEFMAAGLDSEELMGRAVEMVVKKAQVEEHFCFMYADLCRKITDQWSSGTTENEESLGKTFRVRLLDYCKEEFGRDRVKELDEIRQMSISPEEKDEREILLKKRYTGTMRFIGEIYMKNLVNSSIMQGCIEELLEAREEETLVCMCKLIRTIGAKLEANDGKRRTTKVNDYFEIISKMAAEHTNSRIRFMLKDLVDLRKAGWVERRETEKAVKLSDMRDEAMPQGKGGVKSNAGSSNFNNGGKSQDSRQTQEKERPPKVEVAVDEWQTIPDKKSKSKSASATAPPSKPSGFGAKSGVATVNAFSVFGKVTKSTKEKEKEKEKVKDGKPAKSEKRDKDRERERPAALTLLSGGVGRTESPALSDMNDEGVPLERSESYGSMADTQDSPRFGSAGANGESVSKDVIEQVKALVREYFQNGVDEDAEAGIRELMHPEGMGEVLKPCIVMAFDKRAEDREKLVALFVMLHTVGILRTEQVARGLSALLDDLDEISIDVPMAVSIRRPSSRLLYISSSPPFLPLLPFLGFSRG